MPTQDPGLPEPVLELQPDSFTPHRGFAFWASVRAGLRDLRTYPVLVSLTVISVLVATVLVLANPILSQVSQAGEVHVTMNSEIVILLDADLGSGEAAEIRSGLAAIDGAQVVRPSEPEDLESLPPSEIFRFESGPTLVIEPTGFVDVQAIQFKATQVSGVSDTALGIGVLSQLAIDLVQILLPWLTVAFLVAGLLLVANLAFLAARTRSQEAEVMRLVGAGTWMIWLRTGLVIAVPTVVVVLVTTALVAAAVPTVAGILLSDQAASVVSAGPVIRSGLLLTAAAAFIATTLSLTAVWRAATK